MNWRTLMTDEDGNGAFQRPRPAQNRPGTPRAAMHDEVLRIGVTHADGITEVTVTGEIDAASMLALQTPLSELSSQSHILLDMSGVKFMDSSGLRVILTQRIRLTEAGGSIHIRRASPAVERVLQISGLADILSQSDRPQ